jgi:hypothetical protein
VALLRSDLVALVRKYHALSELRRAQHELADTDWRIPLRQLAREFPGALRELDILPLEEIEQRMERLRLAADRGSVEPWMEWMVAYHRLMRLALAIKRRLGRRRQLDEPAALEIALEVSVESGERCEIGLVHAVACPPAGRLNVLVFDRLAEQFGAEARFLRRALVPDLEGRHTGSR